MQINVSVAQQYKPWLCIFLHKGVMHIIMQIMQILCKNNAYYANKPCSISKSKQHKCCMRKQFRLILGKLTFMMVQLNFLCHVYYSHYALDASNASYTKFMNIICKNHKQTFQAPAVQMGRCQHIQGTRKLWSQYWHSARLHVHCLFSMCSPNLLQCNLCII